MTTRFTSDNPCPVCDGHPALPRGQGVRCFGFFSDDARYAHCTREGHANGLAFASESNTYAHFLEGECRCGQQHGTAPASASPRRRQASPPKPPKARQLRTDTLAIYDYTDESGRFLYGVDRLDDKRFLQWHRREGYPEGAYGLNGATPTLYHLPALLTALAKGEMVYVVEGEKDVESIEAMGGVATCNSGGAGKWRNEFAEHFDGANVVVIRDRDPAGEKHAEQVVESLLPVVASVRLVEARAGKDVSDHAEAGYALDTLREVPIARSKDPSEAPEPEQPARPRLLRASEVEPEPIEWLWHGWLARGELHLLDGDMEEGKTTVVMDLASRISRGAMWPDTTKIGGPGTVVVMSAEDDYSRVLRPKLEAMGADLDRVYFFPLLGEEQAERLANIVSDIAAVEDRCAEVGADLLFIDPLFSYIGGDVQTGVDNQVRAALAPLSQMAHRLNMAVLCTRHTTKQKHVNSKHMGGGSVAFSALVRINWLVGPDPLNDAPDRHVLAMNKINLAVRPLSQSYEVTSHDARPEIGIVRWLGESGISARDINRAANADSGVVAVKRTEAEDFLLDFLADGPRPSKEVQETAKEAHGVGRSTLYEAKNRLGVVAEKPKGAANAPWQWRLPGEGGEGSGRTEESTVPEDERTLRSNGTLNVCIDAEIRGSGEESGPPATTEPFDSIEESAPVVRIGTSASTCSTGCGRTAPVGGKCRSCAVLAVAERHPPSPPHVPRSMEIEPADSHLCIDRPEENNGDRGVLDG